jgi:hypothetical protein
MESAVCNIFQNVWDTSCDHEAHVISVLSAIRSGKWKSKVENYRLEEDQEKRRQLKNGFPCVTFCGTFERRKASMMRDYSGVVVIDIDDIPFESLQRIKDSICSDWYTAACFVSPSFGLKVLFVTNNKQEDHKYTFEEIRRYFQSKYNIKIDRSGKDVSRLCFISYDRDLYFNNDYKMFNCDISKYKRNENYENHRSMDNMQVSTDAKKVFDVCRKFVNNSSVGRYAKGNRNNYIHALACNLNRAGMDKNLALSFVSARYQSLTIEEVKTTVFSAYNNNPSEYGSRPILERKSNQKSLL